MNYATVSCAGCGHQFPLDYVRQRSQVTCNCGMRISAPDIDVEAIVSMSTNAFVILLVLGALLTSGYVLARKLLG